MKLFRDHRGPLRLIAIVAMCVGGSPCFAQTESDQDLMRLNIEELANLKVYSASRHLEDSRKAPSAVTIITHEEIDRYGWRTVGEILRGVRGFYTAYDRNYTYVGVRGFLQSGDYNARVLLLINGHRINENIYDSGLIGTEFPLDLDLIDRVEVVRGPSSSLFGTNGELGVVNVITRRPKEARSVEVAGNTGSFLARSGRLTASFRKGRVSGLLSGSLNRSPGASRLFFPEFASPETNQGFAQNLDGDNSSQVFADMERGNLRVQGLFASRGKIIPTASYETNFNDPANRTSDTRGYVDVSYLWNFSSGTTLDFRGYYDAYRFWGSYAYGALDAPDHAVQINDADADWTGVELVFGHNLGKHRLVLGTTAEYNLRVRQLNYYVGDSSSFLDSHERPWFAAGFGEVELNLTSKLTLNVGSRIDGYNTFGVALSPRVALMYLPNNRTSLKYIFGRGFRGPDPYDSYYVDQVDITAPSRHLRPEDLESHNVVLEHRVRPWLGMTVEGFYNNLNNVIEQQAEPDTGLVHFANGKGDRGRGVEFEVDAKHASGWSARASYTFVGTQERVTGAALFNSPQQLAKAHATIPLTREVFAGLELLYVGPQKSYQFKPVASSLLTNATLSTHEFWGGWRFSASCYNAFNRAWSTPTGPDLVQSSVRQDGRGYRFKITYRLPIHAETGR